MSRLQLFKKLLPGFIPLFVFIAADEIWGTRVGLVVAVVVGIGELAWVFVREKRFDKFILFDTLLLIILGGVSIFLNNDIFFKLKPGLIELILVAILGVSAFSSLNVIGMMSKRYMKDMEMNEVQTNLLKKSLKVMFFLFAFHTILVFYSAFYMSKGAWAFISGGLFYILFGVYLLFELAKQRFKKEKIVNEEWLPVVNDEGKILGKTLRSLMHKGEKILHPVVHLHVLNNNKTILLQKRSMKKDIQPGKWDTAVGGHVAFNETLETTLKREADEEIGLKDFSARLFKVYRWDTSIESELVYVFLTYDSKGIKTNTDEVDEVMFWTAKQIEKNLGSGIFTPNLEHEFSLLKKSGII